MYICKYVCNCKKDGVPTGAHAGNAFFFLIALTFINMALTISR
jgi:hypothetical protein